jgi:hypothetical protein
MVSFMSRSLFPCEESPDVRRFVGWVSPFAVPDELKNTEICFLCQESKCDFCAFGSLITPSNALSGLTSLLTGRANFYTNPYILPSQTEV